MQKRPDYPTIYLYRRIVCAKLFIDRHFADQIDLDQIAGEASFSKFHFIRLFKAAYNYTPHQYLTRVRLEKVKLLLQKGESVTEACYAVGFDSAASFSLLFKRMTGVSPSAYRDAEVKRNAAMKTLPQQFIPNCFAEQKGWVATPQLSISR